MANRRGAFDGLEGRVRRNRHASATPQKVGPMDKDLDQAKGRIKQAAGDLTDNERLKKEGKRDEAAGKAKEFLDDVKDKADDMVDRARDRVDD